MSKFNHTSQKGSMMVEALAMLGLIAMVTPVLYRKAAERTTELQDINVASQIRMVSAAVDAYLKDNYTRLSSSSGNSPITWDGNNAEIALGDEAYSGITSYLPEGFDLNRASKLFEDFKIAIHKDTTADNSRSVYTSAVVANLKDDMTKMRAAKIATMIGTNGGIFEKSADPDASGILRGTQGTWESEPSSFGFTSADSWKDNSLVSISSEAINSAGGDVDSSEALYRIYKGDESKNTMSTSLYFGGDAGVALEMQGHDINGVANINGDAGKDIVINPHTGQQVEITSDLLVDGDISAVNGNFTTVSGNTVLGGRGEFGELMVTGTAAIRDLLADTANVTSLTAYDGKIQNLVADTANVTSLTASTANVTSLTASSGRIDDLRVINISGSTASFNTITSSGENISFDKRAIFKDVYIENDLTVNGDTELNTLKVNGPSNFYGPGNFHSGLTVENGLTADVAHVHDEFTVGGPDHGDYNRYVYVGSSGYTTTNKANLFVNQDRTVMMDSITASQSGLAIGYSDYRASDIHYELENKYPDSELVGRYNNEQANVIINRNGVIVLASPNDNVGEGDKTGFIRARRLVSDIEYPRGVVNAPTGITDPQAYYYQVNPAYTSVMNDIKLASRGGARLSDILPDNINKGIYVADNTWKEVVGGEWATNTSGSYTESEGFKYTDNTYSGGAYYVSKADEVELVLEDKTKSKFTYTKTANEVTSPWLGFLPDPQCPPGYDKIITVEPFRFRMSEVWQLNSNIVNDDLSDKTFIDRINPNQKQPFEVTLNDKTALSEVTVSGTLSGDTVTITLPDLTPGYNGEIANYQINTWLNTSIAHHEGTGRDDMSGWHVVMGFLYSALDYGEVRDQAANGCYKDEIKDYGLYNRMFKDGDKPKPMYLQGTSKCAGELWEPSFAWNLFPVYNQEMAAIARVYCSFNRYKDNWVWSDSSRGNTPVYSYDQLNRYHHGYEKDTNWIQQVNDPSLPYLDAW